MSAAAIPPLVCPVRLDATLDQVLYPCLRTLPRLPDTHTDTPAQPLVNDFKGGFHIR